MGDSAAPVEGGSSSDAVPGDGMFVTTSSVLERLNGGLEQLRGESDAVRGRFELQKRLPDGSAVPATAGDVAASDFRNKLQQSAQFVAQLQDDEERYRWAHRQRRIANELFRNKQYAQAMDLYLTCLVVCPKQRRQYDALAQSPADADAIAQSPADADAVIRTTEHPSSASPQQQHDRFLSEIVAPVLGNLAQCALQLGNYSKAIRFCNMALDRPSSKHAQPHNRDSASTYLVDALLRAAEHQPTSELQSQHSPEQTPSPNEPYLALSKLHFKRSKAHRLSGNYDRATKDHRAAQQYLSLSGSDNRHQASLDKEHRLLQRSKITAKRNRQQHKAAMRKAMAQPTDSVPRPDAIKQQSVRQFSTIRDPNERLRRQNEQQQYTPKHTNYNYKHNHNHDSDGDEDGDTTIATYFEYYLTTVQRIVLGDKQKLH